MIYDIIISPLETVFDWIFHYVQNAFPQAGIIGAIFGVSLAMNLLALPLYNMADKIQDDERKISKKLEHWTNHIKRTFKGDERFMMLSEYYRQNHYHPIYALRSTFSILIQVPFFIAAYHYLRNSSALTGASFLIFKDLSAADSLVPLRFGNFSFTLNILPILMTAINCVSGAIYSKEQTFREKSQIYILAAIFLVLLYNSPSGLVIYWILNNLFSLLKNFVKKSKNKFLTVYLLICVCFLVFTNFSAKNQEVQFEKSSIRKVLIAWIFIFLPLIQSILKRSKIFTNITENIKNSILDAWEPFAVYAKKLKSKFLSLNLFKARSLPLLIFSGFALALLCGFVLPSSVISTSPIEFSFLGKTDSPLEYVKHAFFVCLGFFVFYPVAFYFLFGEKTKNLLPPLLLALFVSAACNVYILKFAFVNLDVSFNISDTNILNPANAFFVVFPLEIFIFGIALAWFCQKRKKPYISVFAFACCIGMSALGAVNTKKISSSFEEYAQNVEKYGAKKSSDEGIEPVYHLSKTGKNVFVLFLDRGIGSYAGEIFENYPEIKKQFDGFVWYKNTVSFSSSTVTGAPPLYGGYEYTQENMNKRKDELLRNKNTESQLVPAKLFLDAGFSATMTDPIWPNYRWSGDLSQYGKLPELTVKEIEGRYYDKYLNTAIKEKNLETQFAGSEKDKICRTQIINFSFLQILFPKFRQSFYQNARFKPSPTQISPEAESWLRKISNLYFLPELTDFKCESEKGAYISLHSLAAHDVYTPADDFETPASENLSDITAIHYRANIAAFKQFGKFFDYLRKNNCWNNTRIIIVSDHGRGIELKQCENWRNKETLNWYNAMLLVKDFDSNQEVQADKTFMTNADTIFLAKEGLGLSDINPYTNKKLVQEKSDGVNVYSCVDWNAANFIDMTEFELKDGFHISGDIYEEKNWIPIEWKRPDGGEK